MKRYIYFLVVMIITASLILGGCSSSPTTASSSASSATSTTAGATKTATPTTTTTTSSTQEKVYEFKFTDQFTSTMFTGQVDELLAKMINEKTNGRVKFTFYHSESLGKQIDFLNMIKGGIVDAVNCSASLYPAPFEMELGAENPGLGITDRQMRLDLTWELYNKGYFTGLKDYKVLGFVATPALTLFLKKKVLTIDDLKGLKLRTTSAPVSNLVKLWGGTPVTMPGSEQYMNLERGVIDGTNTAYESFIQMKLYEVAKYAITDTISMGSMFVLMNKNQWNSIPPDLQAKVDEAIQAFRPALIAMTKEPDTTWPDLLKQQGMEVYSFSPEEAAKLKAIAAPIKKDWVAEKEGKGLPAQKMMDFIDNFVANYNKK